MHNVYIKVQHVANNRTIQPMMFYCNRLTATFLQLQHNNATQQHSCASSC